MANFLSAFIWHCRVICQKPIPSDLVPPAEECAKHIKGFRGPPRMRSVPAAPGTQQLMGDKTLACAPHYEMPDKGV